MGWYIFAIYLLMYFLTLFILKCIEAKENQSKKSPGYDTSYEWEDNCAPEFLAAFWPILIPLAAFAGICKLFMIIGDWMSIFIENYIIKKKQ